MIENDRISIDLLPAYFQRTLIYRSFKFLNISVKAYIYRAIFDLSDLNSSFRSHYKEITCNMQTSFVSFLYIETRAVRVPDKCSTDSSGLEVSD